jgi:hypothetical protein
VVPWAPPSILGWPLRAASIKYLSGRLYRSEWFAGTIEPLHDRELLPAHHHDLHVPESISRPQHFACAPLFSRALVFSSDPSLKALRWVRQFHKLI